MTIWTPKLPQDSSPIYQRIADQLERDIGDGMLLPGSRLPTHRELAQRLGLTVVTVTRAYAEAAARGLIESSVGRGSFVRAGRREGSAATASGAEIDLVTNVIASDPPPLAREVLGRIETTLGGSYLPAAGSERHRAAGAAWVSMTRRDATADRILVTTGAQQAMLIAFASLLRPGDAILTDEVTYHGVKAIAGFLHAKLEPLAMDRYGTLPDALERAARKRVGKVVYLTPTLQNPTGIVMPEKRRRELAQVAEKHGLTIVEDDVYGFCAPDAPAPITSHIPDRGIFLTGVGKSVAPALRVGYLLAPNALLARLLAALNATTLFTSPLGAEIAASWIEDGTAQRIAAQKRASIAARGRLARRILGKYAGAADSRSPHLWIQLPRQWSADECAETLRRRGVRIATAASFATGPAVPRAIRISLGAPTVVADLQTALQVIGEVLAEAPVETPEAAVV